MTPQDIEIIKNEWADLKVVGPSLSRISRLSELITYRLPKHKLKAVLVDDIEVSLE